MTTISIPGENIDLFTVFDYLPAAVLVVDKDLMIERVNRPACELFESEWDQLIGRSIHDFCPKRFKENHKAESQKYIENPKPRYLGVGRHLPALTAKGNEVVLEIALIPVFIGKSLKIIVTCFELDADSIITSTLEALEKKIKKPKKN